MIDLLNVVKVKDKMALRTGFINIFLSLKFYLQLKKVFAVAKNYQPICYQYDLQVQDYLFRDSEQVVELRPMTTADG